MDRYFSYKRNRNLIIMLIIIAGIFLYKIIFPSKNKDHFLDEIRDKDIKSIVNKSTLIMIITIYHSWCIAIKIV